MHCRDFREMADSYLADELLVETNHDVISHLESCADCRRELAARRELRAKLHTAFRRARDLQIDDVFAARLRAQLRATALRRKASAVALRRAVWLTLAACLLIAGAFGLRLIEQRRRDKTSPAQTPSTDRQKLNTNAPDVAASTSPLTGADQAARMVLDELAKGAAGDHRDCAINHRLPERPIDLEEAGRKFDRSYINLTQAVMAQLDELPDRVEVVATHSCVFEGRRFAHVILRYQGRLVSVLVTKLDHPQSGAGETRPKTEAGPVIAYAQLESFQVSRFETAQHAIFVISELAEEQNLLVARTMAPSVSAHIARAEKAA